MALAYINILPINLQDAFSKKVTDIARLLKVDPNWLMQVMYAESRLKASAINPLNGASGLIQFVRSTAQGLGTSIEELRQMSALEQLDYVYKYYKPYTGKMKSYYDVYAVTFFPLMIGKPDNWILETKRLPATLIARMNPIVDRNKDGKITVAEFKEYVKSTINRRYRDLILKSTGIATSLAIPIIFFLIYMYNKKPR